jgi:hypothetical protein
MPVNRVRDWNVTPSRQQESDLAMPAREITSRHGVDRRLLLPLAAWPDPVARNVPSNIAPRKPKRLVISRVIFKRVGAQNDQFVQEALHRENAFELFMRIMNDPQPCALLAVLLVHHVRACPEPHGPNLATQLCKLRNCRYSD